jgi:hypothetical protein
MIHHAFHHISSKTISFTSVSFFFFQEVGGLKHQQAENLIFLAMVTRLLFV